MIEDSGNEGFIAEGNYSSTFFLHTSRGNNTNLSWIISITG
jgi:hypothetical protein